MATAEQPRHEQQNNAESQRLVDFFGLRSQLDRLNMSLGPDVEKPNDDIPDMELQRWEEGILDRTIATTFREFSVINEILWRRKSIQHLKAIQEILDPQRPLGLRRKDELDTERRELVVANQAMTYNEYLPAVIRQVSAFMDLYKEEFQQLLPYLPQEQREHLREQYRQSVEYLFVLKQAMDERRNYASVRNLDDQIAQVRKELARQGLAPERKQELEQKVETLQKSRSAVFALLSPKSQEKVNKSIQLYTEWRNAGSREERTAKLQEFRKMESDYIVTLDNRLLDILKGNPEEREDLGVPKDFLPQRTYLQAIQLRYEQLREIQIQVAKKKEWSEQHRAEVQKQLSEMRRSYMDNMVMVTQQLAGHHVVMAELTTIQNHFGRDFNLSDARSPTGAETPGHVLEAVDKSMDGARDFHLGRIQAMLTQVDKSFDPNGFEQMKDAGIMKVLETANGLSGCIRNLITALLPEGTTKKQIDTWLDSTLPLAIQESLETGVGPDGKPLTKEEKLQRIRDVIIRFRDTHAVEKYRITVTLLQGMPDASKFAGEQLVQPLPQEEIRSAADRDRLIQKYNGATVYSMLIRQMKGDGEVFDQAYKNFLGDMENLVDTRLGLIAEVNMIKEGWKSLAWALTGAAGGAAALAWITAAVGSGVAMNLAWKAVKAPLHLLRGRPAVPAAGTAAGGTTVLGAAGRVGGAAVLGYKAYLEFQELGEMKESIEKQRTQMVGELLAAGFKADPPDQEETFRYKDGGTEIVVNLREINEAQRGQESAQAIRTLTTAAEMLAVLRFGLGRAFWPIAAVEVTVEILRYGIDQIADRKFVLRAPAWVLAKINMEEATGDSAYTILAKASGEMLSDDIGNDAEDSEENREKREMREKMLFAILHRELREFPKLRREVYGGSEHGMNLKHFYEENGGFKNVFLPAFYSHLYEYAGNRLSWKEVRRGQIDGDWNQPLWPPMATPNVTLVEIRVAMRETIIFFIQHEREEKYLIAVAERDRIQQEIAALQNTNTPEARRLQMQLEILQDMIRTLGEEEVFGKKLKETDIGTLRNNGGKTRAQLIASYLFSHAADIQFAVPQNEIPGLPEGFAFGARGEIYRRCVADIGLRTELDKVHPHTTDEPEGRVYDPILERLFSLDNWLPSSIETTDSRARWAHFTRFVANGISSAAGLSELPENASADAARQRMTGAAIELVQKEENRGRGFVRSSGLEKMYSYDRNTPSVFVKYDVPRSRGIVGNDYPRMESCIRSLLYPPQQPEREFSFDNVVAVFFEARILGNGHAIVLATYVYGDPLSNTEPPEFFVLQSTRGTYAVSNGEGEIGGGDKALGGRNFLSQIGAREMIDTLAVPLEKRRQRIIEQRRKKHEEEKKLGEKRAEMQEQQELARQTAKRNPGVWHVYPHEYLDSYKEERRHEHVAYYRPPERESGYFLYLRKPHVQTGPAWESADKTYRKTVGNSSTTRIEVVDERTGANYHFNRMGGWYLNYLQEHNTFVPNEIFTEGLAMPIKEDPLGSVRKIVALFVNNIDDTEHRESENLILEQYKNLETDVQRHDFLQRLEWTARKLSQEGKVAITKVGFKQLLAKNGSLFAASLDRMQWERFTRGHELCGQPDENNTYTVEKTKGLSPLSVYTRFNLEQGKWEWSPDREHWLAPSLVNVWHTDGHYYSPSGNAIGILRQLEA